MHHCTSRVAIQRRAIRDHHFIKYVHYLHYFEADSIVMNMYNRVHYVLT